MPIQNALNPSPTLNQAISIIMLIFAGGFTPVWVWWSKQYLERHPLTDWLNIITSASVLTAFVVLPLLQFLAIDGLYSLIVFLILAATFWRYMRPEIISEVIGVNNLLQENPAIEFPEFEWVEEA